eukprot:TRINITY_DN6573_c0_g1_i13.p1 TRINITY_DN6573_c0_g1~~TRINITY_DN6573_c0_g1_i13.p1  ORF type:complete len:290 (-),score=87.68 TRINITY_DN6573_c0_g1_i13:513-1382(-)
MAVNIRVKVHPVVLFQITDSYERRNIDSDRVIGTLVGSVDKQCVEVTNCFSIPHKEHTDRVEADIMYAQEMFDLNKKVSPQENLVGWFATGNEVTNHSALIHDYYARETKDPIHLTLDTTLENGRMTMKAYVFVPLGVPGATTGSMFTPVPVEVVASEPEIAGLDLLHKSKHQKLLTRPIEPLPDLTKISEAAAKLEDFLDVLIRYVGSVCDGSHQADNVIGRQLWDLVQSVPKMDSEEFERMLNSNVRDLLMVIYLSQMTKTQLKLNEKLSMHSAANIKEMAKLIPSD